MDTRKSIGDCLLKLNKALEDKFVGFINEAIWSIELSREGVTPHVLSIGKMTTATRQISEVTSRLNGLTLGDTAKN